MNNSKHSSIRADADKEIIHADDGKGQAFQCHPGRRIQFLLIDWIGEF